MDASSHLFTGRDELVPGAGVERTQVLPGALGSQTQEETQNHVPDRLVSGELKRKSRGADDHLMEGKKIKISLGPAVDLGD